MALSFPFFRGIYTGNSNINISEELFTEININNTEYISRFQSSDSIIYQSDGLEIVANYENPVKLNGFFPVFIYNRTHETKAFNGFENEVNAIQEAKDIDGIWRPIETMQRFLSCNTSHWNVELKPNNFALFIMKKYQGNYATLIRTKININDNIYVSKPYKGNITYNQFFIKRSSFHYERLISKPGTIIQRIYNGSIPLDYHYYTKRIKFLEHVDEETKNEVNTYMESIKRIRQDKVKFLLKKKPPKTRRLLNHFK